MANLSVSLIAPAGAVDQAKLALVLSRLDTLNINYQIGGHVLAQQNYLAGTIEHRLSDLYQAFNNRKTDIIWCLRGGYGSAQLIPYLDWKKISSHKPLIGYSDITALLTAFAQHGKKAIHALVAFDLIRTLANPNCFNEDLALSSLQAALEQCYFPLACQALTADIPSATSGVTYGGNLTVLASLCGTAAQLKLCQPTILLLEDTKEALYRLERLFYQLMHSIELDWLQAICLGNFDSLTSDQLSSFYQIIQKTLWPKKLPILLNAAIGHGYSNQAWPIGQTAQLINQQLIWS